MTPFKPVRTRLPTFTRPPVAEVVIGLQFDPLPGLRTLHFGGFWSTLDGSWQPLPDGPAVGQTQEPSGTEPLWIPPGFQIEQLEAPGARVRAMTPDKEGMLQIENSWLVYNWRQKGPSAEYPRFEPIKARFDDLRRLFLSYLQKQKLGTISPNLWEVGYVNFIPRNSVWSEATEWPRLFPALLSGSVPAQTGTLQSFSGRWIFLLPAQGGRLHVSMEHGKGADGEVLVLKLIARGRIDNKSDAAIDAGFALGHESVVKTFSSIISEELKTSWGYSE